jgi:DNA replication licensing factor MCM2
MGFGDDHENSEMQISRGQRPSFGAARNHPMDMDDGQQFSDDEHNREESDIIAGDNQINEDDNISGDDLMENAEDDYKAIPQLDRYEARGIDDANANEVLQLNADQKANVDMLLNERDRREGIQNRRVPVAMMEEEMSQDDELGKALRRERMKRDRQEEDEEDIDTNFVNFEEQKGNLTEWLSQPKAVKFVRHQFSSFLRTYKDENMVDVYEQRITEMCANNRQSLEVTYSHLSTKIPTLAIWVAEHPKLILPIFDDVASELVNEVFPSYENIYKEIYVRIKDLPIEDKLRDLRHMHVNALIKIKGVITKRTSIFPEMKKAYFICKN